MAVTHGAHHGIPVLDQVRTPDSLAKLLRAMGVDSRFDALVWDRLCS